MVIEEINQQLLDAGHWQDLSGDDLTREDCVGIETQLNAFGLIGRYLPTGEGHYTAFVSSFVDVSALAGALL